MDEKDRTNRQSRVALVAGDAHPRLAEEIALLIGTAVTPASISAFADGETRVRIESEVQDADLYIVQPTSAPTNERLMTLALIADAARITAVLPYFGYARQEVRDRVCLLVDDMASTGGTLVAAAESLARAGAREIHALFVHAVMAPGALERICAGRLRRIITTDSVPNALDARVQVVPIAPLLARTISRLARQR